MSSRPLREILQRGHCRGPAAAAAERAGSGVPEPRSAGALVLPWILAVHRKVSPCAAKYSWSFVSNPASRQANRAAARPSRSPQENAAHDKALTARRKQAGITQYGNVHGKTGSFTATSRYVPQDARLHREASRLTVRGARLPRSPLPHHECALPAARALPWRVRAYLPQGFRARREVRLYATELRRSPPILHPSCKEALFTAKDGSRAPLRVIESLSIGSPQPESRRETE